MAKQLEDLTGLEFEIMQVIWRKGARTAAEVQAALQRKLAYTTVQTVLNTLYQKGKLRRTLEGRAHVYSASLTEARALKAAVRNLLDRAFSGSGEELVMNLVRSREIAPERLRELSDALRVEAAAEATASSAEDAARPASSTLRSREEEGA